MKLFKWLLSHRMDLTISVAIAVGILIVLSIFGIATWLGYERSEFLALLQVVIDLSMVPITVIGFIIVLREFRKSEAKPYVELFFVNNTRGIILSKPIMVGTRHVEVAFFLRNSGSAIARWYSVEIQIPHPFFITDMNRVQGRDIKDGSWSCEQTELYTSVVYRSDGTAAIFLNRPLEVFRFHIAVNSEFHYSEEPYEAPYLIASDWGEPLQGYLWLQVVSESLWISR